MPREEHSWERGYEPDGEVSWPAAVAIGVAFLLVQIPVLIVVGFSLTGLLVGFVAGVVVIVLLSKVVAQSQRPARRGPPPDLL